MRRLALLLLVALPATAHVGDLFGGTDVLLPEDGPGDGLSTAWGVLWADDGGDYRFVCHDVLMGPQAFTSPAWQTDGAGTWLGVMADHEVAVVPGEPMYRSTDGCTFEPVEGLSGERLGGLVHVPGGEVWLASTGDPTGSAENDVRRSTDGGATWAPTALTSSKGFFRGFAVRGEVAWTTAVTLEPASATVHRSLDGGVTWDTHAHDLTPAAEQGDRIDFLDVLGAHPADADVAWFVQGPIGGPDVVWRTDDGGQTLTELFSTPTDIVDSAVGDAGDLWVCTMDAQLWHAPDGRTLEVLDDAPRCGAISARPGEVVVITRDDPREGRTVRTTDGGATWEADDTVLLDRIAGPADCPAGTAVGDQCPAAWDTFLARLDRGDDRDTGEPDPDPEGPPDEGRCGPALPLAGFPVGLALLALLARRRR